MFLLINKQNVPSTDLIQMEKVLERKMLKKACPFQYNFNLALHSLIESSSYYPKIVLKFVCTKNDQCMSFKISYCKLNIFQTVNSDRCHPKSCFEIISRSSLFTVCTKPIGVEHQCYHCTTIRPCIALN